MPAESALALIDRSGAKAVLDSLFRHRELEEQYSAGIASGDSAWFEVARRLRPVSDASLSFGLDLDLAAALPLAPTRVLRALKDSLNGFSLVVVCGDPVMEAPDSILRQHRARVRVAFNGVTDTSLFALRDRCLEALEP